MQTKYLSRNEFQSLFKAGEKLVFDVSFPFSNLTTPPNTIWTMWHWAEPESGISTGTAYAVRVGYATKAPLKIDAYSLQNHGGELPILHIDKEDLGYHHIYALGDFPPFVIEQLPSELLEAAKRVLEKL